MKIIDNINDLKNEIKKLVGSIGLVPTMGALHNGHKSLIDIFFESLSKNELSFFVSLKISIAVLPWI